MLSVLSYTKDTPTLDIVSFIPLAWPSQASSCLKVKPGKIVTKTYNSHLLCLSLADFRFVLSSRLRPQRWQLTQGTHRRLPLDCLATFLVGLSLSQKIVCMYYMGTLDNLGFGHDNIFSHLT